MSELYVPCFEAVLQIGIVFYKCIRISSDSLKKPDNCMDSIASAIMDMPHFPLM